MPTEIKKVFRVFVSSTQCMLIHERSLIIDSILNSGHIPIAQEFDFQDANDTRTLQKCIDKVTNADAIILVLSSWYGSIIDSDVIRCDNCQVNGVCPKYNEDKRECKISYTHFEYLLGSLLNKNIYVLKKDGLDQDDTFLACRSDCKLECSKLGKRCVENCSNNIRIRKNPEVFFEWTNSLCGGMVSTFTDDSTLIRETSKFLDLISNNKELLSDQSSAGMVPFESVISDLQRINRLKQIEDNVIESFFPNQEIAISEATELQEKGDLYGDTLEITDEPIIRILCFRGNSFLNGADTQWEPLIFSAETAKHRIECVLADLNDEAILQRRFHAFKGRYKTFEKFKSAYTKKMGEIEKRLLNTDDDYLCSLFLHKDAELPFRMLFIGDHLYLSFFLNGIKASDSPVYKINKSSCFYTACNEYYERIKNNSEEVRNETGSPKIREEQD